MADDEVHDEPPEEHDPRSRDWVPPPRHVAADRAGVHSLSTVQHIAEGLAAAGEPDEPVVLDRRGPHRSIAGLERLLDEALEQEVAARRDEGRDVGDDGSDEGC